MNKALDSVAIVCCVGSTIVAMLYHTNKTLSNFNDSVVTYARVAPIYRVAVMSLYEHLEGIDKHHLLCICGA